MKPVLIVAGFAAALVGAVAFALFAWQEIGETKLSLAGYLALGFGIVATLALGIGLMALVFISNRRGYDEIDRRGPPG